MKNHDQLHVGGIFEVECYDKDGNLKWKENTHNSVVNEGLDHVLNAVFLSAIGDTAGGDTILNGWAVGLITGPAGGNTLAAGDTHASHAGWSEYTSYTDPANADSALSRPTWGSPDQGASAGDYPIDSSTAQSLSNSSPVLFDITGGGTIAGLFIVGGDLTTPTPASTDANNKGSSDATPLLFSTANFSSGDQTVVATDTLRVTYTLNAA